MESARKIQEAQKLAVSAYYGDGLSAQKLKDTYGVTIGKSDEIGMYYADRHGRRAYRCSLADAVKEVMFGGVSRPVPGINAVAAQ